MNLSEEKAKEVVRFAALYVPHRIGIERGEPLVVKKIHQEMLRCVIENEYANVTGFRGCAKSTWLAFIYPLFLITMQKEPYIVIIRETKELAREAFDGFKADLEDMAPSLSITVTGAGELALDIAHPGKKIYSKIRFASREKKFRGSQSKGASRPTCIIMDDIDSYESVESRAERERTKRIVFGEILKSMDAKRRKVINVGNYIHQECNVAICERDTRFKTLKIRALEDDESVWSERFSAKELKEEYANYKENGMGHMWLMEMMCELSGDEGALLGATRLKYCTKEEALEASRLIYIVGDTAITESRRSDNTAFVAVGISENNDIYLLEIKAGRWSAATDKQARQLYELEGEFPNVIKIGIEEKAGAQGLAFALDTVGKEKGRYLPIEFIKASNERDAKFKRIMGLEPMLRAGKIFVVEGISHQIELENEVEFFPRARRDDIIDAISYIQHFIIGKDYRKKEREQPLRKRRW